jgi:hypothetical protein
MKFLTPNWFKNTMLVFFVFTFFSLMLFSPHNVKGTGVGDRAHCHNLGKLMGIGGEFIVVVDKKAEESTEQTCKLVAASKLDQAIAWAKQFTIEDLYNKILPDAGSEALQAAISKTLNKIAYDTATYIGSGGKGQKPMFITEGWGKYMSNIADEAAGDFIESLGKSWGTNFCSPSGVKIKIMLGLKAQVRPSKPACTFTKMLSNWDTAIKSKSFLNDFQDMFKPTSNDLGVALTSQSAFLQYIIYKTEAKKLERETNKGWISSGLRSIEGKYESPPGTEARRLEQVSMIQAGQFGKYTGSALVDAANVFLNQLAITAFQNLMSRIGAGAKDYTSPYSGDYGLTNANAGPDNGGASAVAANAHATLAPDFSVRGDYDILGELSACPNPTKAGPTNCVITEKFRQAIIEKKTVGQAIADGTLNANGIFGFVNADLEPRYADENYPYRSMIILRKFRILPVGWEVGAEWLRDHPSLGVKTLQNMVDCFNSTDVADQWCKGLVDPTWVLKAPLNYCKKEGPGPELISENTSGGTYNVGRNDNYCADEQSCIKEKPDGSCQTYGYCTEEKRIWNFGNSVCEPQQNTCQTFTVTASGGNNSGQSVSYLKNTLDYGICNSGNAGCKEYEEYATSSDTYSTSTDKINWNDLTGYLSRSASSTVYLDNIAQSCDPSNEGCHTLIRQDLSLIHEKLLPNYLMNACYTDHVQINGVTQVQAVDYYQKKNDAPTRCDDFARTCKQQEAGCALYTSTSDNFAVPAIKTDADVCPAECVGYNTYTQTATRFDVAAPANFIPRTARACGAESAGCQEFTNLDKLNSGAEARESYTYIRECIKPDTSQCGNFYTWEGSDESGYQLKNFSLKKNGNEPAVTTTDTSCNPTTYNSADPAVHNPDCRQFYATDGSVSYHTYTLTISCSDDCHPYRRTADQVIYNAIPSESISCPASANDCHEYTGPNGANTRIVLNSTFESGTSENWSGGVNSNVSLMVGGHSLSVSNTLNTASTTLGSAVTRGKPYVLSFEAKAATAITNITNIKFVNDTTGLSSAFTLPASLSTSSWQLFKVSLADSNLNHALDHEVTSTEKLKISANGAFYIDDIRLTEVTDRYYFIKNSWVTPAICDSPSSMLGCDAYTDQNQQSFNLHSFTSLCQEESVGCELMTDTKNTATTTDDNPNFYAVYDSNKLCAAEDKACERLGVVNKYTKTGSVAPELTYQDVYLKNDPDAQGIQCSADAVSCQEWSYGNGSQTWFKNPGSQTCEYRQAATSSSPFNWYQTKVKRCSVALSPITNSNLPICSTDSDCSAGQHCVTEPVDIACNTTEFKTFGSGGSPVYQPGSNTLAVATSNRAGICDAGASGCAEIIDPISQPSTNLLFNSDFSQDVDNNGADGWEDRQQIVTLKQNNALYIFSAEGTTGQVTLTALGQYFYELKNDNTLATSSTSSVSILPGNGRASKRFYVYNALSNLTDVTVTVGNNDTNVGSGSSKKVELKKAMVNYQLADNLDFTSCNGMVDYSQGCVLFNQRDVTGSANFTPIYSSLFYDADAINPSSSTPVSINHNNNNVSNSNILIKVTPDRDCNKWLACKTMVSTQNQRGESQNLCFDLGLCDSMDQNGQCNDFVISSTTNQTFSPGRAKQFSNLSGYSKVGDGVSMTLINNDYPLGAMDQTGQAANVANGNFEFYGDNSYPIGWQVISNESGTPLTWTPDIMEVVKDPVTAQSQGIRYPMEGRSFLRISANVYGESESIDVSRNTEYVVSAYINTINLHPNGSDQVSAGFFVHDGLADLSNGVMDVTSGLDWTFKQVKFNTGDHNTIKIGLFSFKNPETVRCNGVNNLCQGVVYYDDIKIKPALDSRVENVATNQDTYIAQSCRLYPKDDALSCDYYDDSGTRDKGLWGYCLEHDRYPGSSAACTLWWPVDQIKGDEMGAGAGYADKTPLYYCLEATGYCGGQYKLDPSWYCSKVVEVATETGQNKFWSGRAQSGSTYKLPIAANPGQAYIDWGNYDGGGREEVILNYSRDDAPFGSIVPPDPANNPYEWSGTAITNTSPNHTPLLVKNSSRQTDAEGVRAGTPFYGIGATQSSIYNVGTPAINNSNNVICGNTEDTSEYNRTTSHGVFPTENKTTNNDSDITVTCPSGYYAGSYFNDNDTNYSTSGSVKGVCQNGAGGIAIIDDGYGPGHGGDNCKTKAGPDYRLVGCEAIGNASCAINCNAIGIYNIASGSTNMEKLQNSEKSLKRLFSQTYGAWEWVGSPTQGYYQSTNISWSVPNQICGGTPPVRPTTVFPYIEPPATGSDYCGIPPQIANIKVNTATISASIPKSGFINLTFNTVIDSQQLPLTMYSVIWGDGTETTVSGVEIRDQSNPNEPHSLFHLYDYWYMKEKVPGSCSNNQCTAIPKIQVKDNWGWCNGHGEGNSAGGSQTCGKTDNDYVSFRGSVIINKR